MGAIASLHSNSDIEILIIDDELKARASLHDILKLSGYRVAMAENVNSAIELINEHNFPLILLDLNMPVLNGHHFLDYLAHHDIDTQVLIISGEATFAQAARSLRFNFVQEFIKKPYAVEALLHSVKVAAEKIRLKEINNKVQAQLSKSEQLHRFFVDSSPDIIYMLNDRGEFVFLNNAIANILGYDKSEIIGKHYSSLVYQADLDKAKYAFNERRTGDRSTKAIELRLRCKNSDQPKYVETNSITIVLSSKGVYKKKKENKEFVGTYGVIRDINDRKLSENTLRKLNLAVENSPNLIYITDSKGTIEYANPKIFEISGYTAEEIIGKTPHIFSSGETPPHEYQELWSTITSGKIWRGILKNRKKTGQLYWAQQSIAPMLDSDNRVTNYVAIQEDVTEILAQRDMITYQATHDPLTDLINRTEFDRRLKRIINTAKTKGSTHVLCYLDLDNFKIVNDTCSHTAGDELLRQISRQLSTLIRNRDSLARLGGDEFAILMEHCTLEQAQATAERIRQHIERYQFRWDDKSFRIGVSIGMVTIHAENGGFDELLKRADIACYIAKQDGRNRSHVFTESDQACIDYRNEAAWPEKIEQALSHNRFRLYRQRIVALKSIEGDHYEVLLRLQEDSGKIIAPNAFLPAAERYQLAASIDRWVIQQVFNWMLEHPDRLSSLTLCSINLSTAGLNDKGLIEFIIDRFMQTALPAEKFCFEITETATIVNLTAATQFITSLKELGCRFSLDNFGSGLSSFAYLKNLPVDFLKIDGVFVRDIETDSVALAMVKSINDIAHVMNKKTIAKFVENDSVMKILLDLGIDYVQGYGSDEPSLLK
ncbi:EAL domain-containing protein [Methylotuvimicrobium sp. KM2]|uniref:EAL domain-containing protein n=1 Tax=Methylotuvimicrobium sp. KM2 TaxID=3133976 RepID=UPI003100E832